MQDIVDKIMEYESGEMSEESTINFFQELVDSGMAWTLQGHYGRTANQLIELGYVKQLKTINEQLRTFKESGSNR